MKIRTNLVSNSSSSSFIVVGKEPSNVCFCQITDPVVLKKISKRIGVPSEDILKLDVYLTEFLSDSLDIFSDFCEDSEESPKKYDRVYTYSDGECGGSPYWEEDYIEIDSRIYLFKEDSEDFYVSLGELCGILAYVAIRYSSVFPKNLESSILKFKERLGKYFKGSDSLKVSVGNLEDILTYSLKIPEVKKWFKENDSEEYPYMDTSKLIKVMSKTLREGFIDEEDMFF